MDGITVFKDLRTEKRDTVVMSSGIGKRDSQQDAAYCYVSDTDIYAVVCDGMGGLDAGEKASLIGIEEADRTIRRQLEDPADDPSWMAEGIIRADAAVFELTDDYGNRLGAGSTYASVYIHDGNLYWAGVGDSRIYLIHGAENVQLSTDLNYGFVLDQRLSDGEIGAEEYHKEIVQKEALVSFLGVGSIEMIDRNLEPLRLYDGDFILVCSDGLYRTIDIGWMSDILQCSANLEEVPALVDQIIAEADKSSQDNFTYIIIRYEERK